MKNMVDRIKENWTPHEKLLVHWDDKTMDTLDRASKEKRLPITVSGYGHTKLLASPSLGTNLKGVYGRKVTEVIIDTLIEWDCKDKVYGMEFDTTASNTGCKTGVCVTLQKCMKKNLLWLPCRHHVGEVMLSQVWKDLEIESSQSSGFQFFDKLKKYWTEIDTTPSDWV